MTAASSSLRLALLLQLIFIPLIHLSPTHAHLAFSQNQNASTIGRNVQNLVDKLTADPDIRYRNSTMITCYIAVDQGDHDPEHFHEYPLSRNISSFRDIRCVFRYGGPLSHERFSLFQVQNRWPLHWDQWGPPSEGFYYPLAVPPSFSWREAVRYMSAERADRLLKANGQRGPYALLSLGKYAAHPDGAWCFLNVQIPDPEGGGQRTYFVDVRTGRVEETRYCADGEEENWGIPRSLVGVPTADYQ